jgi:hypothetical protein
MNNDYFVRRIYPDRTIQDKACRNLDSAKSLVSRLKDLNDGSKYTIVGEDGRPLPLIDQITLYLNQPSNLAKVDALRDANKDRNQASSVNI